MNRLSLLLAAAATAVVLVLCLSEPAQACHRGEPHGKHTSCDGGGDGGGGGGGGGDDDTSNATYLISVDPHDPPDTVNSPLYDPPADCLGTNPDQKGSSVSIDVVMPRHHECATVVTSEGYLLTDDIRIWVTTDNNGDIVSVQLIGQDVIGSEGLQHRSDLIQVTPQTPNLSGDFTLHVDADNVTIWKCDAHRIKRNTNCDVDVGTISMGDFTYILQ